MLIIEIKSYDKDHIVISFNEYFTQVATTLHKNNVDNCEVRRDVVAFLTPQPIQKTIRGRFKRTLL